MTSVEASSQKQKSSSQKDENQLLNQLDNFLKKNNMEKLRQTIGSLEKDIEHGNKDQTNKKKIQQQLRRKKIELDILENPPLQYKIPDLGNDLQIKNVEKEIQQLERKIEQVDKDIKKNIRSKKSTKSLQATLAKLKQRKQNKTKIINNRKLKISLNDNNPTSHFIFEIQHFDDNIKIILNSLASELVKNNHEFYHWVVFYLNIDVQEDDDDNNSVISNLNNEFNEIYTETYKQTQKKNPIVIGEIESDSSLTPYKNLLLKLQQYTNIYLDIQELCSILLMIDDLDIETNSIIISNDVNDRIDDLLQHINDQNQNTHYDIEKDENTFYDKSERNSYTYIKMLIENFYEDNAKNMKTSNSPDIKKENLIYLIKNFDYTDEAVMNYLEDFVKNPLSLKQQKRKRPQQKLQQQRQQNGGQKKKRSPRCLPRIYKDQEYNQIVKKYPEERARTSRTSTLIENGIKTSQFTERDKWAHRYGGNNLCLTKMEKEEAYRLKQSKNYEELRTFFQNIRNMYGDGFNSITPKKKSSVSSTVMKSKKVKTPLLQTNACVTNENTL